MSNLTKPKLGEEAFIIPSTVVYIILKELDKLENKYKEKTMKWLITSRKRINIEIASNLLHNTLE
jgi:hypothetical protein